MALAKVMFGLHTYACEYLYIYILLAPRVYMCVCDVTFNEWLIQKWFRGKVGQYMPDMLVEIQVGA